MNQKLKALAVLDIMESSWFLNGGFHESLDSHLIDVKGLQVNIEDFHSTLRMVTEQTPDVLLLDSTLPSHFVSRMVIQMRDKMPSLPILLLPNIHSAVDQGVMDQLQGAPEVGGNQGSSAGAPVTTDTIARTIRYVHGRLGLQRTLLQMALRDDLTGLHNRRGFTALASQHLRWARDMRQPMLLFFADLDGLKLINDHFGHCAGDRAISLVAACIRRTFRKSDVTARLSGDEFVAMVQEEPGRSAESICQRLQINLADCAGAESRYQLSLSVGVAHFDPQKPVALQELMRQADTALYENKRRGRSRVSEGVLAANRQATPRAGGSVKRRALGESTTMASSHRRRSVDLLEATPSGVP
jgi:two-component system, cell cycle response regulator